MSSRGEKYHRRLHPVAPDPTTDLETIQFGHVDVEDDEVGAFALTAQGVEPIALGRDLVAGETESARDEISQGLFVVDDEDVAL